MQVPPAACPGGVPRPAGTDRPGELPLAVCHWLVVGCSPCAHHLLASCGLGDCGCLGWLQHGKDHMISHSWLAFLQRSCHHGCLYEVLPWKLMNQSCTSRIANWGITLSPTLDRMPATSDVQSCILVWVCQMRCLSMLTFCELSLMFLSVVNFGTIVVTLVHVDNFLE